MHQIDNVRKTYFLSIHVGSSGKAVETNKCYCFEFIIL